MLRVHVVIGALMPSNFFFTLAPLRLHISTLEGGRAQQLPRAANYPGQRRPQKNVWLNVTGVVRWGTGNRHEVSVEKYLKYKGCTTIL